MLWRQEEPECLRRGTLQRDDAARSRQPREFLELRRANVRPLHDEIRLAGLHRRGRGRFRAGHSRQRVLPWRVFFGAIAARSPLTLPSAITKSILVASRSTRATLILMRSARR